MCTLIVLDRVVLGAPLVIASNRDEFLSRPAAPPALVEPANESGIPFVAPHDLEAGGTWMGVNAHGVFVGLTNRPTEERRSDLRSRGLLVMDALQHTSARRAAENMLRLEHATYAPFNLYVADGEESWVTCQREDGIETIPLEPGAHVLCNRDLDDRSVPKIDRLHRALAGLDFGPGADASDAMDGIAGVLSTHASPDAPFESVCIHADGYGTRSSAVIALASDRWRYWYAGGAPCTNKYRNLTALLDELRQTRTR